MSKHPKPCNECWYLPKCSKEWGTPESAEGGYCVVMGTHFCRASWDDFKCTCKKKRYPPPTAAKEG